GHGGHQQQSSALILQPPYPRGGLKEAPLPPCGARAPLTLLFPLSRHYLTRTICQRFWSRIRETARSNSSRYEEDTRKRNASYDVGTTLRPTSRRDAAVKSSRTSPVWFFTAHTPAILCAAPFLSNPKRCVKNKRDQWFRNRPLVLMVKLNRS